MKTKREPDSRKKGYLNGKSDRIMKSEAAIKKQIQTSAESDTRKKRYSRGSRPVIGILVDWITSQYQVGLTSGVIDAAEEEDASVLCFEGGVLCSPHEYEAQRNMLYDLVSHKNADGLIFLAGSVGHFMDNERLAAFLRQYSKIPIVSISRDLEGITSVLLDNRSGMRNLMNHLIHDHGYKRIAIIRGHEDSLDAQERYNTYLDVLKENNIPFDPVLVTPGRFSAESGVEAIKTMIDSRHSSFDAVVALNDEMALGIIRELRTRGINVPLDIAVVGFDNIDLTRYSSPPLTTVSQPVHEMGKSACRLLFGLMKNQDVPLKTTMATELVIRESCGCSAYRMNPQGKPYSIRGAVPFEELFSKIEGHLVKSISEIIEKLHVDGNDNQDSRLVSRLVSSFKESLVTDEPNTFLNAWDELLYVLMVSEIDILECDEILMVFRRYLIPNIEDRNLELAAMDLYHNALGIVGRKAVQVEKYSHQKKDAENYNLNMLRDDLLVISNVDRLTEVLASGLPRIGIENAYIALYEAGKQNEKMHAKLVLAYRNKKRERISGATRYYEPEKIIPDTFYEDGTRTVEVVEPLIHSSEFLGFMVLDFILEHYLIYEELRRTISRALHGAILFEEVQSQTRAIKQNEKSLRAITEAIPIPLVTIRMSDGKVLYANIPFCNVFSTLPVEKRSFFIHDFSANPSAFEALRKRLESEKKLFDIELPMIKGDGTQFWVIASFQTLYFSGEKCYIAGFYDITERRRLENEVLDISGREQKRIGQELHDDICQDLVGISTLIQAIGNKIKDVDSSIAKRAEYVSELVNKTNEKTQWLAHGLFPQDIDEKGFAVMLRDLASHVKMQFGITCTCTFKIREKLTDNATILHLYRIAQEAVNNAVKHAKPSTITITFASDESRIEMEITDDGIGIPADSGRSKGLGLRSMRYRASMISARLEIKRNGERGTKIACLLEKSNLPG